MKKYVRTLLLTLVALSPTHSTPAQQQEAAPMIQTEKTFTWKKIVGYLDFPEGPAWDSKGTLFFSAVLASISGKFPPKDTGFS